MVLKVETGTMHSKSLMVMFLGGLKVAVLFNRGIGLILVIS